MAYINARCRKILELLLTSEDYVQLRRIADEVNVSKRSIYYDLCKVNEWLDCYNIPNLVVERGKGIYVMPEIKQEIEEILKRERRSEEYIFSPIERTRIIICYIIHWGDPVYIEELTKYCRVSRNTIFNDLQTVVKQLQEYGLALIYESKQGYLIEGDIIQVRALFFLYFTELLPLFEARLLNFIDREEIHQYFHRLQQIEKEMQVRYVDGILLSLSALLPLMYKSKEKPYFRDLNMDEVIKTQEFQLILKYFGDLEEREQIYLCIHLLGSRTSEIGNRMFQNNANQSVYEIAKTLVAEFEKTACVVFEDKDELERALFLHISTSLYRYQYGIQIGNPMSEAVIREYPNIVSITKLVSKYLSQAVGLPVPDSEVTYLALHFGAYLKVADQDTVPIRILIVCVNGMATGNMLKREVQKLMPDAEIVGVVSVPEINDINQMCDLIVSTVKLQSEVPVAVVQPILTDSDRKKILSYRHNSIKQSKSEGENLFEIVKKYVPEENHHILKTELSEYFQRNGNLPNVKLDRESRGLIYFLAQDHIQIVKENMMWHEAIWLAGKKLLEAGSIVDQYLETIVSQIRYYGPYMFVSKGLVLAHAKPEDGVNHLDVSLTVFQQPIAFPNRQEARVIITLATEDQEKHLKILKDIMSLFSEEENNVIETIVEMDQIDEIRTYLQSKLV
ncbi:BglG family transcription antiterminator [Lachnospiraceae bacterium OttesenSCG-928-E19]|nr:BglG family transcription antiterminator [Lachnospiraceae bacterium OttesenSCG-928-E19]